MGVYGVTVDDIFVNIVIAIFQLLFLLLLLLLVCEARVVRAALLTHVQ